jgi:hypothetical protein
LKTTKDILERNKKQKLFYNIKKKTCLPGFGQDFGKNPKGNQAKFRDATAIL